jgi:DNA-binding NarL/FixJ family response regulator
MTSSTSSHIHVCIWGAPRLRAALEAHGISCGQTSTQAAVIALETEIDLGAVRRTVDELPGVPILVVVPGELTSENGLRLLQAFELGATAAVPSSAPAEEIARAVEDVVAERMVEHPLVGSLLVLALRTRAVQRTRFAITTRERDVLRLLVEGYTVAEIARMLGIAFHTVQTHVKHIYRKLDVNSKAAATALALRHQLV